MKENKKLLLIGIMAAIVVLAAVAAIVLIPGTQQNNRYRQGITYLEHGLYNEAIESFSALGDYQDSSLYLDYCLVKRAALQDDWKAVGQYAARIPGFKDADQYKQLSSAWQSFLNDELETALNTLNGLEALPETAELRKKSEAKYVDQEMVRISDAMRQNDWEQALKHIDQALNFSQDSRLTQARTECNHQIQERDYQRSMSLIRQEQYADALSLLRTLTDYQDSQMLITHLEAGEQGEYYVKAALSTETDPHQLAAMYSRAGDYQDAPEKAAFYQGEADRTDYGQALELMSLGDWLSAREVLTELNGYEDSLILLANCDQHLRQNTYDEAVLLMNQGNYEKAAEMFGELGSFRDSLILQKTCQMNLKEQLYQMAVADYEAGNTEKAYTAFRQLENYKDSQIYCAWIENKGGSQ